MPKAGASTKTGGGDPKRTKAAKAVAVLREQHTFLAGTCSFTIDKRYELIRVIGKGAYGTVISCKDLLTGKDVAIKKITKAFEDVIDSKRILREMMLLRHLRHENTIGLLDIIPPAGSVETFDDVYMVLELMETDLHRIIHSKQSLTDDHAQFFISQVLRGLKYIHSAGVLHRDLKPSNLLVNSSCDLKICDFGLARGVNEDEMNLTEYVVTRWYRAPEVMLSSKTYTYGVDVWSTGCILAELLLRRPLFQGDDYIHQLQLINEILGHPSDEDMAFITSEKAKKFMSSLPNTPGIPFENQIPNANPHVYDLLRKMLAFNPAKRITIEDALKHPYLEQFASEPAPACSSLFVFPYDSETLDAMRLRELVWQELIHFRPEASVQLEEYLKSKQKGKEPDAIAGARTQSDAESVQRGEDTDESKKRRRPEDTITPVKSSRYDPSLFASLSAADDKSAGDKSPIDDGRPAGDTSS